LPLPPIGSVTRSRCVVASNVAGDGKVAVRGRFGACCIACTLTVALVLGQYGSRVGTRCTERLRCSDFKPARRAERLVARHDPHHSQHAAEVAQ